MQDGKRGDGIGRAIVAAVNSGSAEERDELFNGIKTGGRAVKKKKRSRIIPSAVLYNARAHTLIHIRANEDYGRGPDDTPGTRRVFYRGGVRIGHIIVDCSDADYGEASDKGLS